MKQVYPLLVGAPWLPSQVQFYPTEHQTTVSSVSAYGA